MVLDHRVGHPMPLALAHYSPGRTEGRVEMLSDDE
jgi:hypothetical protein